MVRVGESLERARLLLQMGRPADAERELRGILVEEPELAAAHALLGLALVHLGRTDEALEESREAVRLQPEHWLTHYLSGQVHLKAERPEEALRAVTACLSLAPDHAPAHELLARVHLAREDTAAAIDAAGRGLALAPEDAGLASLLAVCLSLADRHEEARWAAGRALSLDPENATAHWAYGRASLGVGDPATAADAFREVLRLDPGFDAARDYLVHALKLRNPVHRVLSRLRRRFLVGWRLVFLLPAAPPVILVFALVALLHWAAWIAESWTTLRLARAKATRLLFETAAARMSLLCCALPVAGAGVLALGIALGQDAVGTAGTATMALVTPVQEAAHTGSATGRRVLYGWAGVLAVAAVVGAVTAAFGAGLLATYAALATIWIAGGVRKVFRPRRQV
jgi:tetratricopeptide (TPR) repeat protein